MVCEYDVFSRLQRRRAVKHLHSGQRLLETTSGTAVGSVMETLTDCGYVTNTSYIIHLFYYIGTLGKHNPPCLQQP